MEGERIPEEMIQKIDDALSGAIGLHGSWVLAFESYNDVGQPSLVVAWSADGTAWQKVGMASALLDDLRVPFRREGE